MRNAIELIGIGSDDVIRSVVKDLDDATMMQDAMVHCGYDVQLNVTSVAEDFDDWALKDAEIIAIND